VPVPVNPTIFRVTNIFHTFRAGVDISIQAGAFVAHPEVGILLVTWTNPNVGQPMAKSGAYRAPGQTGPLALTCVRGDRVSIEYAHGKGVFDLRKRRITLAP
jgi:hypothetical protein